MCTITFPINSEVKMRAAVYFRVTSEDDIYVQAVQGFMSDMLDRARQLPPPAKLFKMSFQMKIGENFRFFCFKIAKIAKFTRKSRS